MLRFDTTNEEDFIISKIVERVTDEYVSIDKMELAMDITVVHKSVGLRLKEMFEAPRMDFFHDIMGIRKNIDRRAGILLNHFHPRYAA